MKLSLLEKIYAWFEVPNEVESNNQSDGSTRSNTRRVRTSIIISAVIIFVTLLLLRKQIFPPDSIWSAEVEERFDAELDSLQSKYLIALDNRNKPAEQDLEAIIFSFRFILGKIEETLKNPPKNRADVVYMHRHLLDSLVGKGKSIRP